VHLPTTEELFSLQTRALAEGRQCVVGGLIANEQGRIFVQRRSRSRTLFPGCWDIVGGHVEAGETLVEALAREIREETGWTLSRIAAVVDIFDWEAEGLKRREFSFLAEVEGDAAHPVLERTKVTEHRWIGSEQLEVLKENRRADDLAISHLVRRALELYREC